MDTRNTTRDSTRRALNPKYRSLGELYIWSLLALAVILPATYDFWYFGESRLETFRDNVSSISSAILIIIFPIFFRLTFGAFPLESIFVSFRRIESIKGTFESPFEQVGPVNQTRPTMAQNANDDYLLGLALSSRHLAKTIFSRAGLFLLVGVFFAVSGLLFFYMNTVSGSTTELANQNTVIISLAKHFGILFFIEFIAFFFLRQYRSAMDEFRYYESLQRSREETYAMVKLIEEKGEKVDVFKLVENCGFRSGAEKLDSGQSTDLLESKKLAKDEAEIISKIVEYIVKK